jgi:hypothetical protein
MRGAASNNVNLPVLSMPLMSHGKRSFFKYAAPDTVLAILETQKVRYSSPLSFNDPFDVQSGLHFDFDLDTLHDQILDRINELAAQPAEPQVDTEDPWGKLVLLVRQHYTTHGFPRQGWKEKTAELFAWLVNEIRTTQRSYQEHWRKTLLPGVRVFCVSENRDNLLMWAHYAKDHSGAVFEFQSLPDEDNPLSVAEPVRYVDRPPPFFTESEWIDNILSVRKFDVRELNRRYVYYKSQHWFYEEEWRVWYPLIPSPAEPHDYVPIRQSEFAALYLGCKAERSFADKAVALTRRYFPNARIYRARKKDDEYALEYEEI